MTVSYTCDVSSTMNFLQMAQFMFRWRGSFWKAVLPELLLWMLIYAALNVFIRLNFNDGQMRYFKEWRDILASNLPRIPLVFLLGFFVTVVFNRWVAIFNHIGFIDNLALSMAAILRDSGAQARLARRNVVRYAVLSQALVFRDISLRVRKRFPTISSLRSAGLMLDGELELYEAKRTLHNKYWMPIQWAMCIITDARHNQQISSDVLMWQLLLILEFRKDLEQLCCYDWVPVPMSYPQIAFLAVRLYVIVQLVARQGLPIDSHDTVVPMMTIVELTLLVGWVKVAEATLNPFGEDDDDFECNYVIDRNFTTGLEIVELDARPAADVRDALWDAKTPRPLDEHDDGDYYYSEGADNDRSTAWLGKRRLHEGQTTTKCPRRRNMRRKSQPYHGSVADLKIAEDNGDCVGGHSTSADFSKEIKSSAFYDHSPFNQQQQQQRWRANVGYRTNTATSSTLDVVPEDLDQDPEHHEQYLKSASPLPPQPSAMMYNRSFSMIDDNRHHHQQEASDRLTTATDTRNGVVVLADAGQPPLSTLSLISLNLTFPNRCYENPVSVEDT